MDRHRAPVEFGFTTPAYVPRENPRPVWRTLLFGALLALIPIVGAGVSAVYIDRRRAPGSYDFAAALRTAVIQLVAIAALALIVWVVVFVVLGLSFSLNPQVTQR